MAKRKRQKQRKGYARSGAGSKSRWQIGVRVGLVVGGFVVLALVATLIFFNRDDQVPDQTARQQAVDEEIASLPVEPRVGALAPDFTLSDMSGNEVSLSDYRGQPVVVSFFHTW